MPLLNYDQQYDYLNKLVQACKKAGIPKETTIALAINAAHESYLNPWTIEGAINPGRTVGMMELLEEVFGNGRHLLAK